MKLYKFLFVFLLLFSFVGCSTSSFETNLSSRVSSSFSSSSQNEMFNMEFLGESSDGRFSYYRDLTTDVMFLFCRSSLENSQGCGFTIMLDSESGLPLTYFRFIEIFNNKFNYEVR